MEPLEWVIAGALVWAFFPGVRKSVREALSSIANNKAK